MVARSLTDYVSRTILIAVLATGMAHVALAEQAGSGAASYQRYEAARAKQQQAGTQGDAKTYETQQVEAANHLQAAVAAFKAQFDESQGLGDALGYVNALREQGDHDLAAEFAGRVLDSGTESAVLWREYGAALLTLGEKRWQQGIDALYKSLTQDKVSQEAVATWNELGSYYLRSEMPRAAGSAFEAALAIDPADVRARLGQLVVDVYNGDVAQAGARLTSVGRDAQPYDALLRAQLRQALTDFDTHRRVFTDTAENHFAYARLLYSAARHSQAILAAQRATRLAKNDTTMWNFLGAVQVQTGDYSGAQRSYEASLRADANQPAIQQTVEKLKNAQQQAAQQAAPAAGKGPLQ